MTAPNPRLRPIPCRGARCDATIAFVITTAGKMLPIDLEPDPTGNIELTDEDVRTGAGTRFPRAIVHAQASLEDGERYLPHFATCPDANEFRA